MAENMAAADVVVVSYEKQTVDSPNPLARFAHRARIQKSLTIVDEYLPGGGRFADFGAGTGLLLSEFGKRRPDASLFGIEPFQTPYHPGKITYVPDLTALESRSLDVISAFEVCEHMYETEIRDFLGDCRKILTADGKLIISVPVMYGVAAVPKFVNRILLYRRNYTGYGFKDLLHSTFGIPIERPENPRHTHTGFDFRWLMRIIAETYVIQRVDCSPFRGLPWYFNSQVILVATAARRGPCSRSA
jgi:SAM-dependent methyltransferase